MLCAAMMQKAEPQDQSDVAQMQKLGCIGTQLHCPFGSHSGALQHFTQMQQDDQAVLQLANLKASQYDLYMEILQKVDIP